MIFAGVATVLLWAIPMIQVLTLPLVYLNTHIHELCHAFAALGTGGSVAGITVFHTGSGVTLSRLNGWLPAVIVSSAGYLGAALVGAAMIVFGKSRTAARNILWGTGAVLLVSLVVWTHGDSIGVMSGLFWALTLWASARFLRGDGPVFAVQFLGLQQCVNAFQSLFTLLKISAFTEGQSDARILGSLTGLPAVLWSLVWILLSLMLMFTAFRVAWQGGPLRPRRSPQSVRRGFRPPGRPL
jgi:hypothetical protein